MNLWRFLSGKDMALGFINQKENVKKNNRYFLTPEESAIKFIKILKNA